MSRRPKKSDAAIVAEKNRRICDEAKWTQQLREQISRTSCFNTEAETLQRVTQEVETANERQDSSTAPNFPRGMRVVDYNAMREAQILHDADQQIKRGGYTSGSREGGASGPVVYAEPAEPFHIPSDKIPGPARIDPSMSIKPAAWGRSKEKLLRNKNAAKERAAKYAKEDKPTPKTAKAVNPVKATKPAKAKPKADKSKAVPKAAKVAKLKTAGGGGPVDPPKVVRERRRNKGRGEVDDTATKRSVAKVFVARTCASC